MRAALGDPKVDLDNGVISIALSRGSSGDGFHFNDEGSEATVDLPPVGGTVLEECSVAKDARILIDGKEAQLKDLKSRMRLSLRLASDKPVMGLSR